VAERGKQIYRIVIDGPQQAIFDELTRTDRPLPAIFNARCTRPDFPKAARCRCEPPPIAT